MPLPSAKSRVREGLPHMLVVWHSSWAERCQKMQTCDTLLKLVFDLRRVGAYEMAPKSAGAPNQTMKRPEPWHKNTIYSAVLAAAACCLWRS
jgi:hypothetical protein